MTRSVGGLLPPIVQEYFLLVTSDFIHCCTAIIPQQPVVVRFTKPLTACAGFEIQVLLPTSFMKAMFYSQTR